ncbi:efflux RND transporter periplasmic adaptor subunit [Ottowia thiooxydans]|uniref:efflux RND transporter periplasmic adaptor subunit n=1 Tax=Ottowia thiooxydans TaxID=219182 RepID=UPI000A04CDD7|nr:efflux RND transporter periplasmic adaptor subunit [Ottowia thiooxydans]
MNERLDMECRGERKSPIFNNSRWVAVIGPVVSAVALLGCGASDSPPSAQPKPKAAVQAEKNEVRIQPASARMLDIEPVADPQGIQMAWAPARVAFKEDRVTAVSVPVAARVQTIEAHVGDVVKQGDVLATLVSSDALRTRHEMAAALTAQDVASAEVRRQQTMVDKGVGVDVELRAAQARQREATQELNRARGTAALLGGGAGDKLVVRAPRAGVVAERKAMLGGAVEPGAELFSVGDPQGLNLVAEVFETDMPGIRKGSAVQVVVPQLPKPLTGKVLHLGATLDKDSRRVNVIVNLDVQDAALRPGMQARVGIQVSNQNQMLIPVTAVLIKDESRSVVYVQREEGLFEARAIELGQPARGLVPVISGLKPGEKIVVRGGMLLDGAAAQLL